MLRLCLKLRTNTILLINGAWLLALCLVSVAWAAPIAHHSEATASNAVQSVSLRLGRCRGHCPVYRVEIYASGEVLYFANLNAKEATARHYINHQDWQRILDAFNESHFDRLQPQYTGKEHGCRALRTDASSLRIELLQADAQQTLVFYTGCDIPERTAIMWLADTIASVSGARDWWALYSQQGARKQVE